MDVPFILLPEHCHRPSAGGSSRRQMPLLVGIWPVSYQIPNLSTLATPRSGGDVARRTMQLVISLTLPKDKEAL
jgi:hypothetical protein